MIPELARYHRQILLPGVGEAGQRRLGESHALLVGCGALGTVIVDALARAGVGTLTIVDRDVVELTNLQRQILFDESDVERGTPKAIAARKKLSRANSQIEIRAIVEDFNHTNAQQIARDADIILDGLDNFQTRYLLNDLSVSQGVPYCYGGAVGTTGMACTFIPVPTSETPRLSSLRRRRGSEQTGSSDSQPGPCLRCIFPEAPPPGTTPTCDTAGVLASAVAIVAHHQVAQAIKILVGDIDAVDRSLLSIDIWRNEFRRLDLSGARSANCPCCGERRFEYLEGAAGSAVTSLCGRGAVQINPRAAGRNGRTGAIDLGALAARLNHHGEFTANSHLLRGRLRQESGEEGRPVELTVFPDGRAIIAGTGRPEFARAIYDKYIGS